MKILVTGAAGQLGREIHHLFESVIPGTTLYTDIDELDLTDAGAVNSYMAAHNDISHIVNCSGYTAVDRAEQEQALCSRINVDGVRNLANAAYEYGAKIIHISTDYVFDGTAHRPYRESDKVNPVSHYGTSKRKGETILLALCTDAIVLRTSWLFSPYGHNFVKTMIELGRTSKRLTVVCDQIGTPTYARDLAMAILTLIRAHQWVPGIYHFSDEGACSWYDFAKAIHRMAGIGTCKIVPVVTEDYPTVAQRPPYSVFDKTRIKKTYGIEIPHWEESLADCIKRMNL